MSTSTGSGITLTNDEIKDIMEQLKSLENRGILMKGTTKKFSSQEEEFLNFPRPSMTAGLPLIKNLLTQLAKSVLVPIGLTTAVSATDEDIQGKLLDQAQQHY